MPFSRPTLTDLRAQAAADIQAALPGADALLRYSNLSIVGAVLSGLAAGHYGYLDWIARQAVPFTSTDEYLEGWAALKAITRKPATAAAGSVAFTGTDGSVIPAGAIVLRGDGFSYSTTAQATLSAGGAIVPIVASANGAVGNAPDGSSISLAQSIAGVTLTGAAAGPITGGADVENDASLRSRMLGAYAAPPQGGAASDYVEWALAVPGVTRCWVVPGGMGASTVVLYFMMDAAEAAHGGFPQGTNGVAASETRDIAATGDQLTLANALFSKQPVTAIVYAVAPQPNTINIAISGLTGASSALRDSIAAAVRAAFVMNARPGGVTNLSAIEGAIAAVIGTAGFVITSITASNGSVTPGAAGNIVSDQGRLPTLGTITYAA